MSFVTGYLVPFPRKTRFDMSWVSVSFDHMLRLPHFEAGMRTQQLNTKATVRTAVVQNGTIMGLFRDMLLILAQSNERFRKPIPPIPAPMKFAVALRGATQHRKDSELSIGKTYSGKNCQKIMKTKDPKNTYFCLRATHES